MDFIVRRTQRIKGEIKAGGDKSLTHRGLILGALSRGTTNLSVYSRGQDCRSTMDILRGLGVEIHESAETCTIKGRGGNEFMEPAGILDCGNSGTTMRLATGLLAGRLFTSVLTGDESLRSRPMDRVIGPLRMMGADIRSLSGTKYAPLVVAGASLHGMTYTMSVASAQVKSAILLAGLQAEGETTVIEPVATRDHTERMLEFFGADIRRADPGRITVTGRKGLNGQNLVLPGDISSAAFFLVLAAVAPSGTIRIRGVGVNPGRTGIVEALQAMGAGIGLENERLVGGEPVADLMAGPTALRAVELGGPLIPRIIDEIPILAVAATQASGKTVIRDAGELRFKETDRIKAMVEGLGRMSARIRETEDGMVIEGPTRLKAAKVDSRHDHRIAMALAIAGLIADGETLVRGADCVAISCPDFSERIMTIAGVDTITEAQGAGDP